MAIITIKDKDGNLIDIPAIKGDKGDSVDVQVNGTSIVQDGVANIPTIGDGVTFEGLVKLYPDDYKNGSFGSLKYDTNGPRKGCLSVNVANEQAIDNRWNSPIGANYLDLAVKKALTDGKGPEYTPTEKASARARLGLEWRYIGKVETTEDVASMSIAIDENGQPFSLRKVRIVAVNYPNSGDLGGWIRFKFNDLNFQNECKIMTGVKVGETKRIADFEVEKIGNHLRINTCYTSTNTTNMSSVLGNPTNVNYFYNFDNTVIDEFINKIEMHSYQACIGVGAYMEIWGVDA